MFYRRFSCLVLGFWLLTAGAPLIAENIGPQTLAKIRGLAAKAISDGRTPGVAIGIMRDGKVVMEEGLGSANLEHRVPVRSDTVFNVASITKQFTAAAILLLAQDGRLSTNDRVSRFLPDFPQSDDITIRQLLTHTSGLGSFTEKPEWSTFARQTHSISVLVDSIKADPHLSQAGTTFHYSNSGYLLLAAIIERASHLSFGDFLKDRIFDPLALNHTQVRSNPAILIPNLASGYVLRDGKSGQFFNRPLIDPSNGGGGTSIVSTLGDLMTWHRALFGGRVLSLASFREMTAPGAFANGQPIVPDILTRLYPGSRYGYGLLLIDFRGHKKVGHTGSSAGFNSMLFTYPDDKVTIVVINNGDAIAPQLEYDIASLIFSPPSSQ